MNVDIDILVRGSVIYFFARTDYVQGIFDLILYLFFVIGIRIVSIHNILIICAVAFVVTVMISVITVITIITVITVVAIVSISTQ